MIWYDVRTMSTSSKAPPVILAAAATFIGIDYHKKYSVWHAVDAAGGDLGKGRVEHHSPHGFATLVRRWPSPHVVFEATMNWYWLYEVLERSMPAQHITLANPFRSAGQGANT